MRALRSISILAPLLLAGAPDVASAAWSLTTFDPTVNAGWGTSVCIGAVPGTVDDMVGVGHVSYWTPGQGFRYFDSITSTSTEPAAPAVPDETQLLQTGVTALALDGAGEPWVAQAILDQNNFSQGELSVHHRAGGVWTSELICTVDGTPSLEMDPRAQVLHLFCSTPTGPIYAWRDGAGWHLTAFDSVTAYGVMRLDRSRRPCLAYFMFPSGKLYFARRSGGVWQSQLVDGVNSTTACDLAFNGVGQPRIAYELPSGEVRYAEENLGAWPSSTILPAGSTAGQFALAIGGGDHPYLAFHDFALDQLWVTIRTAGVWTAGIVDPQVGAGQDVSMRFDGAWEPVIAYKAAYATGARIAVGSPIVGVGDAPLMSGLALRGPWPNPARTGNPLAFVLTSPSSDVVRLEAFDVAGRTIAPPQAFHVRPGPNRLTWSGRPRAGLVFVRVANSRGQSATTRVVVLD